MSEVKRRAQYTMKFKQEAVRLVEVGQSIAWVARTLADPKNKKIRGQGK